MSKMTARVFSQTSMTSKKQSAISIVLALDVSYSMNWPLNGEKKIDLLKKALGGMLDVFNKADPHEKYIRVGAVAFGGELASFRDLTWNREALRQYFQSLWIISATNTSLGTGWAVPQLLNPKEEREHKERNKQKPKKFMVLMTDGSNSPAEIAASSDARTLQDCKLAKLSGVTIYSVALNAEPAGKSLLKKCASSMNTYYDVRNKDQLLDTFRKIAGSSTQTVPYLSN